MTEDDANLLGPVIVTASAAEPDIDTFRATSIECPTCDAWVGWACKGKNYGYHAAGYHPAREKIAAQLNGCCGIPARTLPACDLPWGHEGRMHGNGGDGFYAQEYDAEHEARQGVRRAAVQARTKEQPEEQP